jgi:hypothetical protein
MLSSVVERNPGREVSMKDQVESLAGERERRGDQATDFG